jgi:hypothetical protein
MRRAALAIAIALTTFSAAAQGVNPAPGRNPPGANPSQGTSPTQDMNPAQGTNPAACDQGLPSDMRKCKAKNVAAVQKAIGKKVAETCQKQPLSAGGRGPGAADERLACRYDMLTKLLESIK